MTVVRSSPFERLVRKNKRFLKLEKMVEQGSFAIDTNKLLDELFVLHSTRTIRTLSSSDVLRSAQKKLLDVGLENVGKRGRCVEIKMQSYRISRQLEQQLSDMNNYLYSRYSDALKQHSTTISERKTAVTTVLQPFYNLLHKLNTLENIAEMVIKDCDQASYTITSMTKAIEISFARERNI